jgi:hypothetical protein
LAGLVATGKLTPTISVAAPWTQIADVARQFLECNFPGKAVLHVAHERGKAECLARVHRYYTQRANN